MKVHELKTQYFGHIAELKKTAELRFNDRDFKVGDLIYYREWFNITPDATWGYSGRTCFAYISHIVSGESPCVESEGALATGYVILSIKVQRLTDA